MLMYFPVQRERRTKTGSSCRQHCLIVIDFSQRKQKQRISGGFVVACQHACVGGNSELSKHEGRQMSDLKGGLMLISSAYSQQALCLKQTNTELSVLSAMALRQPTPQEQSLPKPAAQNNGAERLWNRRMRTIAGHTTMTGNKLLMMSQS